MYVVQTEPGISDDVVLALANQETALPLTNDKDFGELVFRLKRITSGVILIRLAGLAPIEKAAIVSQAIRQHNEVLPGVFTVINAKTVRIRKLEM